MKASLSGDKNSYKDLLLQLTKLAKNFARKKISSEAAIDDIAQEILISVHKSKHTYNPEKPFLPWFYAIANYRLYDHLRGVYNNQETNIFEEWLDHKIDQKDETLEIEKKQSIEKSLKILPEKQRQIVELVYVEGYSIKETAEQMNISVSDVKTSAHRALKSIKTEFGGKL